MLDSKKILLVITTTAVVALIFVGIVLIVNKKSPFLSSTPKGIPQTTSTPSAAEKQRSQGVDQVVPESTCVGLNGTQLHDCVVFVAINEDNATVCSALIDATLISSCTASVEAAHTKNVSGAVNSALKYDENGSIILPSEATTLVTCTSLLPMDVCVDRMVVRAGKGIDQCDALAGTKAAECRTSYQEIKPLYDAEFKK